MTDRYDKEIKDLRSRVHSTNPEIKREARKELRDLRRQEAYYQK